MKRSLAIFTFGTFALIASTSIAYGATYQPLVNIPQLSGGGNGLGYYFNQLYMVSVAIGAILAFIKIAMAGVKYSLSEVVTDKGDAKHDIQGALFGLAILLIPFIVLTTINPNLTKLDFLQGAKPVNLNTPSVPAGTTYTNQNALTGMKGPSTPVAPQYGAKADIYPCASATDCTAARAQCNSVRGTSSTGPTQPGGIASVRCTYQSNLDPGAGAGGNTDSTIPGA